MQIEVSIDRIMGIMAEKLGQAELANAQLLAQNEVLTGRLQEYEQRDLQQKHREVMVNDAIPQKGN